MLLQNLLIKKNINFSDIYHIISHHWTSLVFPIVKNIFFLSITYIFFVIGKQYFPYSKVRILAIILGILIFFKFLVDFLNVYLDGIVLSKEGLTFYLWEGILQYKSELFERDKILEIKFSKNGLRDKIFNKGNLVIVLHEEIEIPFENISRPKKQVDKILSYKKRFSTNLEEKKMDKIKMFAEVFSEVMQELQQNEESDSFQSEE